MLLLQKSYLQQGIWCLELPLLPKFSFTPICYVGALQGLIQLGLVLKACKTNESRGAELLFTSLKLMLGGGCYDSPVTSKEGNSLGELQDPEEVAQPWER